MPDKIEFAAATALVGWKSQFAKLVKAKAIELAQGDQSEIVTLSHYQAAASHAILQLSESINPEHFPYERHEAA